MNLTVDIGNTKTKAAWFEQNRLVALELNVTLSSLISSIQERPPTKIIVSSVSTYANTLRDAAPATTKFVVLGPDTPLPFENTYHTPTTLGTDRIAAVAGAQAIYPNRNVLVVDAGTCVTYEILNEQGQYLGGIISPGLRMRWRAMHTFTARLPLVSVELAEESSQLSIINKSTVEGLKSGGIVGMAAEIDQIIRRYADKFAALQIISCGGDIAYLQPWISSEHKYIPELVLIGLNSIVQYDGS